MTGTIASDQARRLLQRWDRQQEVYVHGRDEGYDLMFDLLDALVPGELTCLDLAAGPGSLTERLLERRPDASSIALDVDPVLQEIGRGALGDAGGRLRWVTADLRDPDWPAALDGTRFDAVLSSTAVHWLRPAELAALYQHLAALVRPEGVLINFDGFAAEDAETEIARAVRTVYEQRQQGQIDGGAPGWQDWWDEARAEPALAEAFAARDAVFPPAAGRVFAGTRRENGTGVALHRAVLRACGFEHSEVVWQHLSKRILVAMR